MGRAGGPRVCAVALRNRPGVGRPRPAARGDQEPVPVTARRAEITVHTGSRRGLFDLTAQCAEFVAGERDGLLNVFVPHATAGVVIMELGAGSDTDLMAALERLLPRDDRYTHRHGSAGHGADHVLPLVVPPSVSVPVLGGRLQLGTWQSIALLDTNVDNERRRVVLTFIG